MRNETDGEALPSSPYFDAPPTRRLTLLEVFSAVLNHRYLILATVLAFGLLAAIRTVMAPPSYTADAAFIPQGNRPPGGVAVQIAGRFGIDLTRGLSNPTESPQLFAELLRSREVQARVLEETFHIEGGVEKDEEARSGTLIQLLDIQGISPADRRARAVSWIDGHISVEIKTASGIISLTVTTPWPELSESLARLLVEAVQDFGQLARQARAAREREFLDERIEEARARLQAAEERLQAFFEANRQFRNSPELTLEYNRLERGVEMHQSLYNALAEAREDARLAEIRGTPLITVVEWPQRPIAADPRRLLVRTLLGMLMGSLMAGVFVAGREIVRRSRTGAGAHVREFDEVWARAVGDLKRLLPAPRR